MLALIFSDWRTLVNVRVMVIWRIDVKSWRRRWRKNVVRLLSLEYWRHFFLSWIQSSLWEVSSIIVNLLFRWEMISSHSFDEQSNQVLCSAVEANRFSRPSPINLIAFLPSLSDSTHLSDWRRICFSRKTLIVSKWRHLLIGRICPSKDSSLSSVLSWVCWMSVWQVRWKEERALCDIHSFGFSLSLSWTHLFEIILSRLANECLSRWVNESLYPFIPMLIFAVLDNRIVEFDLHVFNRVNWIVSSEDEQKLLGRRSRCLPKWMGSFVV